MSGSSRVAAAHGLPEGAEVYARARLVKEGDQPTHTLTNYYRPEHVEGTRLVDPTPGPAGRGGGFRVLYDAGYGIDHMKERLFARAATPDEVKQLQLPPGEPVVELHRTTYTAEGTVVEFAIGVHAASRFAWEYDFDARLGEGQGGAAVISTQDWADARRVWDYHQMGHSPRPCSVAIGLGSHDLGVADTAVDLYKRGMAPLLLFTGATSPTTRERMPRGEAVRYRERAVELGVPSSDVLVEPRARNTGENIRFSRELLEEAGVEVSSVLLISKPYEERRAYATARKLWPGVEVVSASSPMTLDEYVDSIGDARLVIDMLVGALQRLMIYPEQGFMIGQPLPADVLEAYERLCRAGFTSRLLTTDAPSA